MNSKKLSYLLVFIMTVIVIVIEILTVTYLYSSAYEKQLENLKTIVRSQVTLITAVAQYDSVFSRRDHKDGAEGATLSQIRKAYQQFVGFGKTGELVVGKKEKNKIIILLTSRSQENSEETHLNRQLTIGSSYAIPMQLALLGKTGTIVAKDYRGKKVLAAFEFVGILNYGVIAKIDLDEFHAPFFRAGLISMLVTILFILIGSILFIYFTNPIIRRLEESEAYNRKLFNSSPMGLVLCNMDGQLIDVNPAYARIIGRSVKETLQLTYWDITPNDFAEKEQQQLENLKSTGRYGPYEKEYLHKDGYRVPVSLLGQIIERNGKKFIWSSVENISLRKQNEQKIKETQERLQLLLESTGEAIYGIDTYGACTFANPACVTLLGFDTSNDMLGKDMHKLIHYAYANGSDYNVNDCPIYLAYLRGEKVRNDEEVFWRKDGTCFPVEYSSYPIFIEEKIIGAVVTFNDISERKQAEQILVESEKRLNEAQRMAKIGSWELDLEKNHLYWSDEIFRIFENSKSNFDPTYEAFLDAIHPSDREMVNKSYTDSLIKKTPYEVIHRLKMNDGRIKYVRESCETYYDDDGKPLRSIGTVQDITALHKTELELRSLMELNEHILNFSPIGIMTYDKKGQCVRVNPSALKILDLSREKVMAQNFNNTFYWESLDLEEIVTTTIENRKQKRVELELKNKAGVKTVMDCHFVPFLMEGQQHLLLLLDDITDRKVIELELVKYQNHLEELVEDRTIELKETQRELVKNERLATLGQLTATVSHELRNPLSALTPSLYVIKRQVDTNNPKINKALDRIERNIWRCDNIIDEMLDFTRITSLDTQSQRLDDWLTAILDEQKIPKEIKLTRSLGLSGLNLSFDAGRLSRAIINILDNACHAMQVENDPNRIIDGATLDVATRQTNERIEIIITDNGSGMPEDIIDKVFEPLFSTKSFGVGLGMPTVKHIMEQHGGGIEIDSKPANGTRITLWLPLPEQKGAVASKTTLPVINGQS